MEKEKPYNERNKKNKVMKEKSRYFFVHGYDFCLGSFHTRIPDKGGVCEDNYTVFSIVCQNNLHIVKMSEDLL